LKVSFDGTFSQQPKLGLVEFQSKHMHCHQWQISLLYLISLNLDIKPIHGTSSNDWISARFTLPSYFGVWSTVHIVVILSRVFNLTF